VRKRKKEPVDVSIDPGGSPPARPHDKKKKYGGKKKENCPRRAGHREKRENTRDPFVPEKRGAPGKPRAWARGFPQKGGKGAGCYCPGWNTTQKRKKKKGDLPAFFLAPVGVKKVQGRNNFLLSFENEGEDEAKDRDPQ